MPNQPVNQFRQIHNWLLLAIALILLFHDRNDEEDWTIPSRNSYQAAMMYSQPPQAPVVNMYFNDTYSPTFSNTYRASFDHTNVTVGGGGAPDDGLLDLYKSYPEEEPPRDPDTTLPF